MQNDKLLRISNLEIASLGGPVFSFVSQIFLPTVLFLVTLWFGFCLTNFVYICAMLASLVIPLSLYIHPFDLIFVPCTYLIKLFNISQRLTSCLLVLLGNLADHLIVILETRVDNS